MSLDKYLPKIPAPPAAPLRVSISPYVNEPLPNWEEILTAHDVARLTRRPHCVLLGMMMIRQFPQKVRFHGQGIGWLRADVLNWMARDLRNKQYHTNAAAVLRPRFAVQRSLALGRVQPARSARKKFVPCKGPRRRRTYARGARQ